MHNFQNNIPYSFVFLNEQLRALQNKLLTSFWSFMTGMLEIEIKTLHHPYSSGHHEDSKNHDHATVINPICKVSGKAVMLPYATVPNFHHQTSQQQLSHGSVPVPVSYSQTSTMLLLASTIYLST